MKNLFKRLLMAIGRVLSALFNIGIPLKFVAILCVLLTGGSIILTYSYVLRQVGGKEDYNEAMRYIEIKDVVDENFIDIVDRDRMGDSAAAAMVSGLGDKWSSFMSADEYKTFQLSASNEYSGIGMSIIKDESSGGFQVTSINPGTPANLAGLNTGMVIVSVDEQEVKELDADAFRTLIRSKLNAKFTIGLSTGETLDVDCTKTYVSAVKYRMEKTGAGYVQIANFEAGSGEDAIAAIEDLLFQGATALVIDIRNNAGGLETEAAKLLDYLLPRGDLFASVDKSGREEVTESDSICIQLPMVVLVNGGTYSESEIFAAVLQEYHWATIMGEPTTGKTRTQETIELSDGSAIRLSTRSYLTPNRVDISAQGGVVPDSIVYNSDASATGTTEGTTGGQDGTASVSNDEQLMAALRVLSQSGV